MNGPRQRDSRSFLILAAITAVIIATIIPSCCRCDDPAVMANEPDVEPEPENVVAAPEDAEVATKKPDAEPEAPETTPVDE